MEDLFGFDRHKFPKSITRIRRGRKVFYNLRSVMQCMVVFLEAHDPEQRWLAVPRWRQLVLTGIIKRAQDIGTKKVAEFVTKTLQPYLR